MEQGARPAGEGREAEERRTGGESERVGKVLDDTELIQAQKTQERWNDPAAAFLTRRNGHENRYIKALYHFPIDLASYPVTDGMELVRP